MENSRLTQQIVTTIVTAETHGKTQAKQQIVTKIVTAKTHGK